MLHARRNRLRQLEEREANGESFWTDEFPKPVRVKIQQFIEVFDSDVIENARTLILFDEGERYLFSPNFNPVPDFVRYLVECPDDMMPTVIEAYAQAAIKGTRGQYPPPPDRFEAHVNATMREYRIAYELVNGEMVPMASRELHTEVTVPTLRLLAGDPTWERVEAAYQDALAEIASGNAADAVTDAGTALQEALTALGCDGNALGPLIKSAKSKGLLSNHDGPMLDAIYKVADWVSADRSNTGDAHNSAKAHIDDAWLIVHVVGALILRLSRSVPRA